MSFLDKLKAAEPEQVTAFKRSVQEYADMTAGSIDGSRNETLNKLAFRGGALAAEDVVTEYWVHEVLTEASDENGYSVDYGADEVERVILAGFQKGYEETPQAPSDNPIDDLVLNADQLASLPPAEWLVDDLLQENSIAALVADPGTGKSFMALDLAATIVTTGDWHGRRVSRRGTVLYVAGEGLSGLNNRRMAWEKYNKKRLSSEFRVLPKAVSASTKEWDYLVSYVEKERPTLIIMDTLAKTLGDFDENKEIHKYVAQCDRLRVASGGTVLIIHHTNKMGGYRGGSALKGDVDTLAFLHRDNGMLELFVSKQKDGPEGVFGMYRLKTVGIGERADGKPVESAVFTKGSGVPWDRPE